MSAYQVSAMHLATVASYGATSVVEATAIATMLAAANAASVAARYNEETRPVTVTPSTLRRAYHRPVSSVLIVKLVDCIDYQCFDFAPYALSHTRVVLDAIRERALVEAGYSGYSPDEYRVLPAYEAADWVI